MLEAVRHEVARGATLDDAIARFLPYNAPQNLIAAKLERWLEVKRAEAEAGDRSPTYLRELERYAKDEGHFAFWSGLGIHAITYATLEDWSLWLARRGIGAKTRSNVMGAFHSFASWLVRRGDLAELPRQWPWPKVPEPTPRVLTAASQEAVLEAIPTRDRGIFLAMGLMGIRPGEAVALDLADYAQGWIVVARARKGARLGAPVRGTKSGKVKRLPVPSELVEWIETHVPAEARLQREPLFANPRTGGRWTPSSLRRTWSAALEAVGAPWISLYEGTKHTMATDAIRRRVPERSLQAYLGHADAASTRRYARLADQALLEVIRPPQAARGLRAASEGKRLNESEQLVVEAAGIEPASAWLPASASTCVATARFRRGQSRRRE